MQKLSLIVVVLCLITGCDSGGNSNRLPTAPVEVTVTYKGKPVDGAMVTFIPIATTSAPSNGLTTSGGKAKMFTYESGDGAVLGTHKVQIVKQELPLPSSSASVSDPNYDPNIPSVPAPKPLIPRKYFTTITSGLSAEVEKVAKNEITFELKD